jgi:hypothetical protein
MVVASFSAFCKAASAAMDVSTREEIRSLAILFYSGKVLLRTHILVLPIGSIDLLKDESSEVDFVGPTLLALKSLLEIPLHTASNAQYRFDRLVHGLLSACALNIDDMRYA